MKTTLKMTVKTTVAMALVLASVTQANADVVTNPRTQTEALTSLAQQTLTQAQVADLFDTTKTPADPDSDIIGAAEGVPPMNPSDASDVIEGAYTSAELVAQALEERQSMPIGQRIVYLQEQANHIVDISRTRPMETLLRLTLNRSVDVANHILPIAGRNTDEVARFLANFYRENFELAASFGNNKIAVSSRLTPPVSEEEQVGQFLRKMSIAEYGRIYSTLLWRYSQDLTSDSSKAVILMRLVGYLGWDFNADLRRRERPIAQTIADIYTLEHSALYGKLLRALGTGHEPNQDDVAQFRRKVYTIMERIPQRLQQVGVYTGK